MKKDYIRPQMNIVALKQQRLLAGSNKMKVTSSSISGVPSSIIDYGGVDEDGDLEGE